MDISTIAAAVESLKAAKDIAQGMLALKTQAEVQTTVIELQALILEAQGKALQAQAEHFELYRALASARDEVARLRDMSKAIAALSRKDRFYFAEGDPDPLCPRCVEIDSVLVHLTKTNELEMRHRVWACPQCKNRFTGVPQQ